MKGIRRLFPLTIAVALAMLPITTVHAASSTEIESLLRKSSTEQSTYFTRIVNEKLKYVTSRSFVGKDGKWIGFVDLYAQYKNGEANGHVLERASVQYGMTTLPSDTESCTLRIGDRSATLQYNSKDPKIGRAHV